MKRTFFPAVILFAFLVGCGAPEPKTEESVSTEPKSSGTTAVKEVEAPFVAISVDAKSASAMLKESPDLVVVDVRTPAEFAEGHIAGARNIDVKSPDFEEKLSKLDPEATYIVHCRSGARSEASMAIFEKLKFENIIHMNTGFNDWADSGLPVEK